MSTLPEQPHKFAKAPLEVHAGPGILRELKKQFPGKEAEIDKVSKLDPSGSKYAYTQWMWKQVRNGEDPDEVGGLVEDFHRLSQVMPLNLPENVDTLRLLRETHLDELEDLYKKEDHKERKKNPPKVLYDKDGDKVIELFSKEQVKEAGKGTNWCVSQDGTKFYDEYDKPGVRFLLVKLADGSKRMAMLDGNHLDQLRDEQQTDNRDVSYGDEARRVLEDLVDDGVDDIYNIEYDAKEGEFEKWYKKFPGGFDEAILSGLSKQTLNSLKDAWAAGKYPNMHRYADLVIKDVDAAVQKIIPVDFRLLDSMDFEPYKNAATPLIKDYYANKVVNDKNEEWRNGNFKVLSALVEPRNRTVADQVYFIQKQLNHGYWVHSDLWYSLLDIVCALVLHHRDTSTAAAEVLEVLADKVQVEAREFNTLEEFFDQFGEPAGSLLMEQVAKRLGTNRLKAIKGGNRGTQGLVFDMPDSGKVLKLSVPPSAGLLQNYKADKHAEVRTCAILMANPTDLCVHIFDVFGIKAAKSGFEGFGIVMEKLSKLDERYVIPINIFSQFLITKPLTVEAVKAADLYCRTMILDDEMADYEKVKTFLIEVAKYFRSVGVRYLDLHAGNVMQRGDELVLIDFGLSKSPETPIDTLEAAAMVLSCGLT